MGYSGREEVGHPRIHQILSWSSKTMMQNWAASTKSGLVGNQRRQDHARAQEDLVNKAKLETLFGVGMEEKFEWPVVIGWGSGWSSFGSAHCKAALCVPPSYLCQRKRETSSLQPVGRYYNQACRWNQTSDKTQKAWDYSGNNQGEGKRMLKKQQPIETDKCIKQGIWSNFLC